MNEKRILGFYKSIRAKWNANSFCNFEITMTTDSVFLVGIDYSNRDSPTC